MNYAPFTLALAAFCCCAPQAVAGSLESKLEQLGQMNNIKVEAIRVVKRHDFLHVQAELSNNSAAQQSMFYRFKWLDASGFDVGGQETWKQLLLHGKTRQSIQTVAPTPQAVDFRMELQSPDNTVNPLN